MFFYPSLTRSISVVWLYERTRSYTREDRERETNNPQGKWSNNLAGKEKLNLIFVCVCKTGWSITVWNFEQIFWQKFKPSRVTALPFLEWLVLDLIIFGVRTSAIQHNIVQSIELQGKNGGTSFLHMNIHYLWIFGGTSNNIICQCWYSYM